MSEHATLRAATGIDVVFCDAASPWQRGINKKANGPLRGYSPKGSDLSMHAPMELQLFANELSSRPRKCLN